MLIEQTNGSWKPMSKIHVSLVCTIESNNNNSLCDSITVKLWATRLSHHRLPSGIRRPRHLTPCARLSGRMPDLPICAMSVPLCKHHRQHVTWLQFNFHDSLRRLISNHVEAKCDLFERGTSTDSPDVSSCGSTWMKMCITTKQVTILKPVTHTLT